MTHKSKLKRLGHDFDKIKDLSRPVYNVEEIQLGDYADKVHRERMELEAHVRRESRSKASVMMERKR